MLVKLKELLTIKNGFDYKHLSPGKIPVIGTGGVMLYVNKFLYDKEAILLPRKGSLNNIMYVNKPFWTVDTMFYAIPNYEKVTPKYLYYHLSLIDFARLNVGSTIPSMTASLYYSLSIDLPTLEIQNKIANILSSLDSQISRNKAIVKRLQVLAHNTFCYLFSKETNLIFLNNFPYIQIISPGIKKFDGQKNYIATADVEGTKINYNAPLINFETRESRANMQPITNSVWFAKMKNSIKHIYVTKEDVNLINNHIFSTGFLGLKCEEVAFEYLINYLELPYFENTKDLLSHGATQQSINNEDLKLFKIHMPSEYKLMFFHSKICKLYCQIAKINQSTYKLTLIKGKLLPLLINGQIF